MIIAVVAEGHVRELANCDVLLQGLLVVGVAKDLADVPELLVKLLLAKLLINRLFILMRIHLELIHLLELGIGIREFRNLADKRIEVHVKHPVGI